MKNMKKMEWLIKASMRMSLIALALSVMSIALKLIMNNP